MVRTKWPLIKRSSSAHVPGALELHGLELIVWDGMIGGNFERSLNLVGLLFHIFFSTLAILNSHEFSTLFFKALSTRFSLLCTHCKSVPKMSNLDKYVNISFLTMSVSVHNLHFFRNFSKGCFELLNWLLISHGTPKHHSYCRQNLVEQCRPRFLVVDHDKQ